MLERFFKNTPLKSLRASPLGPYLDSFTSSLVELGYAASTVCGKIRLTADFGRWLEGKAEATDLNEKLVDLFVQERGNEALVHRGIRPTLRRFVEHLREQGVVNPAAVAVAQSCLAELDESYETHLRQQRGLAATTADYYRAFARLFVLDRCGDGPLRLNELRVADVSGFVVRQAHCMSPGRAKLMVTALRSFLRFLLQRGDIEADLAAAVPSVADWRLSTIPKYLEAEEVQRLLSACDRRRPMGRRDYAILLLLARLGLRAGEVVGLELGDIDWRNGQVTIRGKGLVHQRLPLLADVGEAIAAYLRQDRPECCSRRVFVQMKAPRRGFAGPSTVSTIVRRALERAGLRPAVKGAHLLRHSLATGLLREGASMAEIGEVLGHQTPTTTEIYAKVDFNGLRSVAQPWPGNGGAQ